MLRQPAEPAVDCRLAGRVAVAVLTDAGLGRGRQDRQHPRLAIRLGEAERERAAFLVLLLLHVESAQELVQGLGQGELRRPGHRAVPLFQGDLRRSEVRDHVLGPEVPLKGCIMSHEHCLTLDRGQHPRRQRVTRPPEHRLVVIENERTTEDMRGRVDSVAICSGGG